MRANISAIGALFVIAVAVPACAKEPSGPTAGVVEVGAAPDTGASEQSDELQRSLYPPDLIMDHQARLGIGPEQRQAILQEVQTTQTHRLEVDADLRRDREALATALALAPVDEAAAVALAERVMEQESRLKALQLRMLIRIKNQLTAEQRAALDTVRRGRSTDDGAGTE